MQNTSSQQVLVGEDLNNALVQEAKRLASKFNQLKADVKRRKAKEEEYEKTKILQDRAIEKLISQLQERDSSLHLRIGQLEQEVQRLQYENQVKKATIVDMEIQLSEKNEQISTMKAVIDQFNSEKKEQEKQANDVKDIFRNLDIAPIYDQVVDLFSQFFPEEDDIGKYMVSENNQLLNEAKQEAKQEENRPKTGAKLPEIAKREATPIRSAGTSQSTRTVSTPGILRIKSQGSSRRSIRNPEFVKPRIEVENNNNSDVDEMQLTSDLNINSPSATKTFLNYLLNKYSSPTPQKQTRRSHTSLGFTPAKRSVSPFRASSVKPSDSPATPSPTQVIMSGNKMIIRNIGS